MNLRLSYGVNWEILGEFTGISRIRSRILYENKNEVKNSKSNFSGENEVETLLGALTAG